MLVNGSLLLFPLFTSFLLATIAAAAPSTYIRRLRATTLKMKEERNSLHFVYTTLKIVWARARNTYYTCASAAAAEAAAGVSQRS